MSLLYICHQLKTMSFQQGTFIKTILPYSILLVRFPVDELEDGLIEHLTIHQTDNGEYQLTGQVFKLSTDKIKVSVSVID